MSSEQKHVKNREHVPVMPDEVLRILRPRQGDNFIDCTFGTGGYSLALSDRIGDSGVIVAIDLDPKAVTKGKRIIENKNRKNIKLIHGNFKNLSNIVKNWAPPGQLPLFSGIVFDLGLSSAQLQDKTRGFSFGLDSPLDMSFDCEAGRTGANFNRSNKKELESILRMYGEERFAGRIAREIVRTRKENPIKTARQLAEAVERAVPPGYRKRKINASTLTFQALRIATNRELDNIKTALPQALKLLKNGGRLAIVSYHSLEDRIVKNFLRNEAKGCICPPEAPLCRCGHKSRLLILTRKPITPEPEELERNPRARSAKLRAGEKK